MPVGAKEPELPSEVRARFHADACAGVRALPPAPPTDQATNALGSHAIPRDRSARKRSFLRNFPERRRACKRAASFNSGDRFTILSARGSVNAPGFTAYTALRMSPHPLHENSPAKRQWKGAPSGGVLQTGLRLNPRHGRYRFANESRARYPRSPTKPGGACLEKAEAPGERFVLPRGLGV